MPVDLDPEERAYLTELQEVYEFSLSPVWRSKIVPMMNALVNQAYEDMLGNLSSDPMAYMRLHLRWQQREAMKRAIMEYIDDTVDKRSRMQEELRERLSHQGSVPTEMSHAEP